MIFDFLTQGRDVRGQTVQRLVVDTPLELYDPRVQLGQLPGGVRGELPYGSRAGSPALGRTDRAVGAHGQLAEYGTEAGRITEDFLGHLVARGQGSGPASR